MHLKPFKNFTYSVVFQNKASSPPWRKQSDEVFWRQLCNLKFSLSTSILLNFFFPFIDIRCFFSSLKLQYCWTIILPNKLKVPLGPEFWHSINFYIFVNSLWLLVTMPNFNSLRRLEVAFFGRFLSRIYGRHYWPLFRKLACELAEVTLERLTSNLCSTFIRLPDCHGKFHCRRGKISCQLFAVRPWNFPCCSSYLCCTMLQQ